MPKAIPFDVAKPGEPPVDHLCPTAWHAGQAGDHPFAVLKLLIAGLERQVARLQNFVGFFEPHDVSSRMNRTSSEPDLVAALEREDLPALPPASRSNGPVLRGCGESWRPARRWMRRAVPRPMKSESSRPTRTLPPIIAACVANGICERPAASTDQREVVAEQTIRRLLHEHEIAHLGADAAEDAEDESGRRTAA